MFYVNSKIESFIDHVVDIDCPRVIRCNSVIKQQLKICVSIFQQSVNCIPLMAHMLFCNDMTQNEVKPPQILIYCPSILHISVTLSDVYCISVNLK